MTAQTDSRASASGEQATAAIRALLACMGHSDADTSEAISAPGEPVVSQDDLDQRAEMAYERWLDRRAS